MIEHRLPAPVLMLVLAAAAGPAAAQALSPAPATGLWESESKVLINGQDVGALMDKAREDMLKGVPPEQREQMRAAMQEHGGGGPGGKEQDCITPEDVARASNPRHMLDQLQKEMPGCRFEPVKVSGSSMSFKGRCTDPEGFSGDITGEFTVENAKSVRFRHEGRGRMPAAAAMPGMAAAPGGVVTTVTQGRSRWVAASCGQVKPMRRP